MLALCFTAPGAMPGDRLDQLRGHSRRVTVSADEPRLPRSRRPSPGRACSALNDLILLGLGLALPEEGRLAADQTLRPNSQARISPSPRERSRAQRAGLCAGFCGVGTRATAAARIDWSARGPPRHRLRCRATLDGLSARLAEPAHAAKPRHIEMTSAPAQSRHVTPVCRTFYSERRADLTV
jgi:hypothetical protein